MANVTLLHVVVVAALAGCGAHPALTSHAPTPGPAMADPHSYARADRTVVTHLALDLTVDFTARRLAGTAAFTVARIVPGAELILDSDGLDIEGATECGSARRLEVALGKRHPILGVPVSIALPAEVTCVAVRYHTAPDAKAVLWVDPSGTAGKRRPMLFTQSEPILGRTWVPLQDTPSVRFTYDVTVRVPPDLMALMSAENPQQRAADGVYRSGWNGRSRRI